MLFFDYQASFTTTIVYSIFMCKRVLCYANFTTDTVVKLCLLQVYFSCTVFMCDGES